MEKKSTASLTAWSLVIALSGLVNIVLRLILKAVHLLGTISSAVQQELDYKGAGAWKDILFSVYDVVVLFTLSWGILASVQIISGVVGIIYTAVYHFRKKPLWGSAVPLIFGIICTVFGAISVAAMIISRSTNVIVMIILTVTQLLISVGYARSGVRYLNIAKHE